MLSRQAKTFNPLRKRGLAALGFQASPIRSQRVFGTERLALASRGEPCNLELGVRYRYRSPKLPSRSLALSALALRETCWMDAPFQQLELRLHSR